MLLWNDVIKTKIEKIIGMHCTVHISDLVDRGKSSGNTGKDVKKTDVIADYNKSMGGVELLIPVIIPY